MHSIYNGEQDLQVYLSILHRHIWYFLSFIISLLGTENLFYSHEQSSLTDNFSIVLNDTEIENVDVFTLLGDHIDDHLRFATHMDVVTSKDRSRTYSLVALKRYGLIIRHSNIATDRPIMCHTAPA